MANTTLTLGDSMNTMRGYYVGYFYQPIPYYKGLVLKCAGLACERNMAWMMAEPGTVLLESYCGDRIAADTHEAFNG